jgi:hypothetical protein
MILFMHGVLGGAMAGASMRMAGRRKLLCALIAQKALLWSY